MSRLKPINKSPKKSNVFHNMTFVILCPKHRKIAVSDNFDERRELAVWLPFVYLSSDIKKRITVEESIALILSDGNPKLMALYKKEQPFDSNLYFNYTSHIRVLNFGFTRTVCLVRLHSDNPVLRCCRKTSRIIWIDIERILNNNINCFWGLQVKRYLENFDEEIQSVRCDSFNHTEIFDRFIFTSFGERILNTLNITEKQIKLFYIDFVEHCFPTIGMTFTSFKDYLGKYGFKTSEKSMKRLFNIFLGNTILNNDSKLCLYFFNLLTGLTYMDPLNCCRIKFIFWYYDINRDGYLSKEELREMIEDIHKNETSDTIDIIVNDYWLIINPFEEGIGYTEFLNYVQNQIIIVPDSFCRFEFRILLKIISTLETRNEGIVSRIKTFVSHHFSRILKKNL